MAKRSRKRLPSVEVASSDPEFHPDATLGPGASLDATRAGWKDRESTNAPVVGEEEPAPGYAQGYPELIDRLLRDKIPFRSRFVYLVLVLAWFGVVSWLFVQDNQAGLLKTIEGVVWFGWKALALTAVAAVAALIVGLIFWLTRPPQTGPSVKGT